jgi:hypothetical protein
MYEKAFGGVLGGFGILELPTFPILFIGTL